MASQEKAKNEMPAPEVQEPVVVPLLSEDKEKNIARYQQLIADGLQASLANDINKVGEAFSEACSIADLIYGPLARESFDTYLSYGKNLLKWGLQQYTDARLHYGEGDSSSDDGEEGDENSAEQNPGDVSMTEISTDVTVTDAPADPTVPEAPVNISMPDTPTVATVPEAPTVATVPEAQADVSMTEAQADVSMTEAPAVDLDESVDLANLGQGDVSDLDSTYEDELDKVMRDAVEVLDMAKQICDRVLNEETNEGEKLKWQRNLVDAYGTSGHILLLSDSIDQAFGEFNKALELGKTFLSEDSRDLSSIYCNLAMASDTKQDYDQAKQYYEKAVSILEQKIATLDTQSEEAIELRAIADEIKQKFVELDENKELLSKFHARFQDVSSQQ